MTVFLQDEDERPLAQPARCSPAGTFEADLSRPVSRITLRAVDRRGSEVRVSFQRGLFDAALDWDLGEIRGQAQRITVRATLEADPRVAGELLACQQSEVIVLLRESTAGGRVVGEARFDLAQAARGNVEPADILVEAGSDGVLVAEWLSGSAVRKDAVPALREEEILPPSTGPFRYTSLRIDSQTSIRGRMLWADGTPSAHQRLEYSSGLRAERQCIPVLTGADGTFCLVVGLGDHGMIGVPGLVQLRTRNADPAMQVAAGDVVTLQSSRRLVSFQLLGERGEPIEAYRVESRYGVVGLGDNRPNGLASVPDDELQGPAWLRFTFADKRRGVFLVPSTWLAGGSATHLVRSKDFMPTGGVEVCPRDQAALPADLTVTLTGTGSIAGLHEGGRVPGRGPWRITDVPAGVYEYSFMHWQGAASGRGGTIEIRPGEVVRIEVADR